MTVNVFDFILLCLATFRLTRLLVNDKITRFIRKPFHHEYEEILEDGTIETYFEIKGKGLQKLIGELLSCYWCTGVWCSLLLYVGYYYLSEYFSPIIVILAIAGCASFLEAVLLKFIE